jgi:hypothetical protein
VENSVLSQKRAFLTRFWGEKWGVVGKNECFTDAKTICGIDAYLDCMEYSKKREEQEVMIY